MISYKDIALQTFSYSSQADYNCYRVIAIFVPNFVAMATGVVGENAIGSIQWSIPENPPIDAKISQISHTHTEFCPKFRSMATDVDRKKCSLQHSMAHPRNPSL